MKENIPLYIFYSTTKGEKNKYTKNSLKWKNPYQDEETHKDGVSQNNASPVIWCDSSIYY